MHYVTQYKWHFQVRALIHLNRDVNFSPKIYTMLQRESSLATNDTPFFLFPQLKWLCPSESPLMIHFCQTQIQIISFKNLFNSYLLVTRKYEVEEMNMNAYGMSNSAYSKFKFQHPMQIIYNLMDCYYLKWIGQSLLSLIKSRINHKLLPWN